MNYKPKITFYKKNDRRKYHIVAILDEKQDKQIVYKYFGIYKQWWHYEIMSKFELDLGFENGLLSIKRNNF